MLRLLNLSIWIDWLSFRPGTSFFIPCLNRLEVQDYVEQEAYRLRMQIVCKHVVEKGKYGLRVWRTA
jgi:hypothetical protein